MEQLTKEQAIKFGESKVYETWTYEQIVRFQLFQEKLCMPFSVFHEAIEKVKKLNSFKRLLVKMEKGFFLLGFIKTRLKIIFVK